MYKKQITPQTLNVSQSANYLGIGRTKFYELLVCGEISPVIFSRRSRQRFLIRDLDNFLNTHRRIKELNQSYIYPHFPCKRILVTDDRIKSMLDKYK